MEALHARRVLWETQPRPVRGRPVADAPDVGRQAIGCSSTSIESSPYLVDANRPRGADAIGLKKDHDLANAALFLPLADAFEALWADALISASEAGDCDVESACRRLRQMAM